MADIVFILGAGASKEAGAPLMNDFLETARDLWLSEKIDHGAEHFELVFRGVDALQAVHSKADIDIHNVESVFSAFQMAHILGELHPLESDETNKLTEAMCSVISKTIESTVLFRRTTQRINVPQPYGDFAELITSLTKEMSPRKKVAVITFNYDIALDYALHAHNVRFDYGLDGAGNAGTPILKLHGSLNWAYCDECQKVAAWHLHDYFREFGSRPLAKPRDVKLQIGSQLVNFKHCGINVADPKPFLIPPTWNKFERQRALSPVWRRAANELSEARDVFVLGYSLPLSDHFFRYLYALGTIGSSPLRRFWVFNPDGEVNVRFEEMLGSGARAKYEFIGLNFRKAIPAIKEAFESNSSG